MNRSPCWLKAIPPPSALTLLLFISRASIRPTTTGLGDLGSTRRMFPVTRSGI